MSRLLRINGLSLTEALATLSVHVRQPKELRLELTPMMLTPDLRLGALDVPSHPIMKKYARRPWGRGRNNFVPHWNTRECARRIVQIAKGQLAGGVKDRQGRKDTLTASVVNGERRCKNIPGEVVTRLSSAFVSVSAQSNANKLRLRAIGMHQYNPKVR